MGTLITLGGGGGGLAKPGSYIYIYGIVDKINPYEKTRRSFGPKDSFTWSTWTPMVDENCWLSIG